MPLYEFQCKKCKTQYSELCKIEDEELYPDVKCPKCKSSKKVKLISQSSFNFKNPEGTDRWNNSHDYRFNTVLPKRKAEREAAEKKSHVGPNPYKNIDDISSGKNFGPVK